MFENITLLIVIFSVIFMVALISFFVSLFKKTKEGEALVINGARGSRVTLSGNIVIPILEKAESINLKIHQIEVFLEGKAGVVTKDNIIADAKATFSVRVNLEPMDIRIVAQSFGTQSTYDTQKVSQLFAPKFEEAIRTVASQFDFETINNEAEKFKVEVLVMIGRDLNGFMLDDLAMNYLTATAKRLEV